MSLLHLRAEAKDDIQAIREKAFGKSSFTSKSEPKKFEVLGTITQRFKTAKGGYTRTKYWVCAKPSRQVGDVPKKRKSISLAADIAERLEEGAREEHTYESTIVESALKAYFKIPA